MDKLCHCKHEHQVKDRNKMIYHLGKMYLLCMHFEHVHHKFTEGLPGVWQLIN